MIYSTADLNIVMQTGSHMSFVSKGSGGGGPITYDPIRRETVWFEGVKCVETNDGVKKRHFHCQWNIQRATISAVNNSTAATTFSQISSYYGQGERRHVRKKLIQLYEITKDKAWCDCRFL